MKRTLMVVLLVNLMLAACAPVTAPTATATPTAIPTATPTATPTLTLPPEQVGGLAGVPDPRVTNPELFNLTRPDAPIPQFVNAMRMAGIEVTAEEVMERIMFRTYRSSDNHLIIAAVHGLGPDSQVEDETLQGEIPLAMGYNNEEPRWQWHRATLRKLSELSGFTFGAFVGGNGDAVNFYDRIFDLQATHFNLSGIWVGMTSLRPQRGNFDPFSSSFKRIEIERSNRAREQILVHPVVWGQDVPAWVRSIDNTEGLWSVFREHVAVVADFVGKTNRVGAPLLIVVNEAGSNDFWYQRLGDEYIYEAFRTARQVLPDAVLLCNDFDNHTLSGSRYLWTRQIVTALQSEHLIDGVGVQLIVDTVNPPNPDDVILAMQSYGIPVYVTEFNVLMGNLAGNRQQKLRRQAEIYYQLTRAALASGVCKAFVDFQTGDRFSIWSQPILLMEM